MMQNGQTNSKKHRSKHAVVSWILAIAMACGMMGMLTPSAQAAPGMKYYLDKVVDWGVMRGDIGGNLNPNRNITRAEFVTMVNRAYGYKDVGSNPFKDNRPKDWFYEDICIAHQAGYFSGTSKTMASPNKLLTREQAAVLIGRNMMLEQGTGESLGFSDTRELSEWSRHMIQAVAEEKIILGYPDGKFRPKQYVTRGQVATMLVRAIGTPVQKSGVHSLGGVSGNLTITAPDVTLKNTTVYGDLYISGGVGLSSVVLENVKVQGKIVVSGTGESEKGEHSVVLRNVTAKELVLDSNNHQFVTLKSEGLTDIPKVSVRTGVYLEDVTDDELGLKDIMLDGKSGMAFQLAGNIKDVVIKTPKAIVTMAQGVANSITVDEKALDVQLNISEKAHAKTVNLDAAAKIAGTGDIGHMNVNAPGSSCTILPDTIVVRPGIDANIHGEVMDSVAAQESSSDPRLLAGYPVAKNIGPKSVDLAFKTNKKGTIYWAVTALADGTVGEEELIHPSAYSGKIIKNGTIAATASNTEFITKMNGLTTDGSYYISAILVDNRGMRSPVKIDAFTTPDDTIPAFATGYPYAIIADGADGEQIIQGMVMPNKNCQMYYALLPKGSSAPKGADFKANAVTGNLGYGVVDLQKNTPYLIPKVNTVHLEEEKDYDLYLWLTDADGTKSSAVKKVTVKTLDRTPPKIQHLSLSDVSTRSVTLTYALNEPGTFYWAVVKSGTQFYLEGVQDTSEEGMAQIESGINALRKGSSNAGKASTDVKVTISGLEPQTAYDVYYMAKDKTGNYCVYDKDTIALPFPVSTMDNEPPTAKQEFTHDGTSGGKVMPYPDTSINLVFSENVQGMKDRNQDGKSDYEVFLNIYESYRTGAISEDDWTAMMREYFKLYEKDQKDPVKERTRLNENDTDWVIDYRKVKFEQDKSGTGELILTFPYSKNPKDSALNLSGGMTYQFRLEGLADTSPAANRMKGERGVTPLPEFTTISAQVMLARSPVAGGSSQMTFSAKPISNEAMPDSVLYDLIVWSDIDITFKLHTYDETTQTWTSVGNSEASIAYGDGKWIGASISDALKNGTFEPLNKMKDTVYGIEITSINGDRNSANWNRPITLQITAVSGSATSLPEMSKRLGSRMTYDQLFPSELMISDITIPMNFSMTHTFLDTTPPEFDKGYPTFDPGDTGVKMRVALNRPSAYYYYVVAPLGEVTTVLKDGGKNLDETEWGNLPSDGNGTAVFASTPTSNRIMTFKGSSMIKVGSGVYNNSVESIAVMDLQPKTKYVAYFVLRGEAQESYSDVYCYKFTTGDVTTPAITLSETSPTVQLKTSTEAEVDWILIPGTSVDGTLMGKKFADYVKPEKKGDYDSHADWANFKVIDAMEKDLTSGQNSYSIFDEYANDRIYQDVLTFIQLSTGTSYLTDRGELKTEGDKPNTLTFQNMSELTQYYCIATAKHPMGTRQSFKAIGAVHLVDNAPPEVTGCYTNFTKISKTKDGADVGLTEEVLKNARNYFFDGTVTITFDKTPYRVYYKDGVRQKEMLTGQNIKAQIADPLGIVNGQIDVSGQTITIPFKNTKVGNVVIFFKDGTIGDSYSNTNGKKLTFTFYAKPLNVDNEEPAFKYEWTGSTN